MALTDIPVTGNLFRPDPICVFLLCMLSRSCKALAPEEIDCLVRAGKCKDGKLNIETWPGLI